MSPEAKLRIDEAMESASRGVEGMIKRRLYPEIRTHKVDWPTRFSGRSWRVWLGAWNELISLTSVTSGGVSISTDDILLYPNEGPPYNRLEINIGSAGAFLTSTSYQQSIEILGLGGWSDDQATVGSTASSINSSDTVVDVTNSAKVGVGTILFRPDAPSGHDCTEVIDFRCSDKRRYVFCVRVYPS